MVAERGKLFTEDEGIKQSYQKYQSLKQEVNNWHQERGSYWLAALVLAQKPPYLPIMDLPENAIIELWQRLNIVAELKELWKQLKNGQSIINQEMISCLQIAISGVAELACEKAKAKGVPAAGLGYIASNNPSACIICPVCGEVASLTVLEPPNGQRIMHCTTCKGG